MTTDWTEVMADPKPHDNNKRSKKYLKEYIFVDKRLDKEIASCIQARYELLKRGIDPFQSQYRKAPWF
jgi:hypothetical protein